MSYQKGIIEENTSAIFQIYDCLGNSKEVCDASRKISKLNEEFPDVRVTISFGYQFWNKVQSNTPSSFCEFTKLEGSFSTAPATGGDLFIHVASHNHDSNFEVASKASEYLHGLTKIKDETNGFRYKDSRDFTGFIDGTANPKGESRKAAALIEDGKSFAGGSFVLVQKYIHNLEKWTQLSISDQEKVMGRTKTESIELKGDNMPPTSHVSRVEISDSDGNELPIVRHSLPFGSASGDKGLYFISYAKDISVFDKMLRNMHGLSDDGGHDELMKYSNAISGAYFFAPSKSVLEEL